MESLTREVDVTAVVPPEELTAERRRLADRILAKGPLAVRAGAFLEKRAPAFRGV